MPSSVTAPLYRTLSLSLLRTTLAVFLFASSAVHAFTPSQQQIEQFMKLSPAEQQALAKSMGVDINDFKSLAGVQGANNKSALPADDVSGFRGKQEEQAEIPMLDESESAIDEYSEDEEEGKEELQTFGYDLFKLGADAFTPATDIPIPADYVLGPGDTLVVQLYGKESASHTLSLSREGNIQFPEIGPVSLAGLSFSQAAQKIEEIVSEQMIGIKSSITMGELRTIRVFVLGEVNVPGSYVVGSLSTMTNALFASGGVSDIGSLRKVALKRGGKTITTLDLYDLLMRGDTSHDARLLPGDVIFVPPVGKIASVSGAVKRPAIYELKHETTAKQLISLAGGLSAQAYLPATKIERISELGEKTLVELNLENTANFKVFIQDADKIVVGSTLDTLGDTITVSGHVKREDEFAWKKGLRFTDIVTNVDQLLPLPDIEFALIEREKPLTREIEVLWFSPSKAFSTPGSINDPLLNPRDHVRIFGYADDRTLVLTELLEQLRLQASIKQRQQIVRVDGSVRFPGEYPLAQNMSALDLVRLAGGFTESALGREGEITRYDINEARERIVMHLNVDFENPQALTIEAGDTLRVKQIPLWAEKEIIELTGEVMHPGVYDILPGETLLDVVKRAGGLTARAYPEGAIFSRAELRELEQERLEALKAEVESDIAASRLETSDTREDIDTEQANEILDNIDNTEAVGRLVIDLPLILSLPDDMDFQLEDGDRLDIPRFKPSVTVVGEVQYPTSHFFNKKLSVKDYLRRSGGLKRNADKKRIYVIKANGEVFQPRGNGWYGGQKTQLSPGDTIVVPLDTKRVDKLTLWASVTRIMYEAALGVAALGRL